MSTEDNDLQSSNLDEKSRKIIGPNKEEQQHFNQYSEKSKKSFLDKATTWAKGGIITTAAATALATPSVAMAQEQTSPGVDVVPTDQSQDQSVSQTQIDDGNQPIADNQTSENQSQDGISSDPNTPYNQAYQQNTIKEQSNPDILQQIADFRGKLEHMQYDGQYIRLTVNQDNKIVVYEDPGHRLQAGQELTTVLKQNGIDFDEFIRSATFVWGD